MTSIRVVPAILVLSILAISGSPANAQCPAVGADTGCGVIITVTPTGASVSFTGQGPYDSIEDTLIGVINNSNQPINALGLTSTLAIFDFDGDGIDAYGIPGNSFDSFGYGGPNAYFTNINASHTAGTVNFIVPIATGGGTAFFSLENALSSATACSSLINNALAGPFGAGTPTVSATFTPQQGYTLAQAAQLCGFTDFDWQQTITSWPRPSSLFQVGNPNSLAAPPSFLDPPPGGYTYELTQGYPNGDHSYPFYYDPRTGESQSHETPAGTPTTLSFSDTPTDPCLYGGTGAGCFGLTSLRGSKLAFTTHLVGVVGLYPGVTPQDLGIGFTWTSTFNGTSGGVATTKNSLPPDPGSGTGGVTITSVQQTTTYGGITITGVNGAPPGAPQTLTAGNACNGVYSGTFNGNVTVSAGQNCTFINGTITGNVQANGGNLIVSGALIGGNVQINGGGTFSISTFSMIDGNLEMQNIPAGTAQSQVCSTTVTGNLQFHNNGIPVQIGSASPSCAGNVIGGNLEVHNNTGSTAIFGNTVSGNLDDHNNTAPTQVFNNTVTQHLQCVSNSTITGGGNTAGQKQGQCSIF